MIRNRLPRRVMLAAVVTLALPLGACAEPVASPSASPRPEAATPSPAATAAASPDATSSASADASDEAAAEEDVAIEGSQYVPEELTIAAGTEVSFENLDAFAHSVTEGTDGQAVEDPMVDEEVAPGDTVTVRFDEPGTYEITCIFHPTMQMTITVEG